MALKSKHGFGLFSGRKSLLLVVAILSVVGGIEGSRLNSLRNKETEEQLKGINKPAVKTIMSEDGDVIDCVDIYKQPAFDHPLLKNHTIEMRPSFNPKIAEGIDSPLFTAQQIWLQNGSCPEGTIPIQRTQTSNHVRIDYSSKKIGLNAEFSDCNVEVARIELHTGGPYIGAQGTISAWNLHVENNEWSLNSVTVFNGQDSFLEAGWAVSPILFRDDKPRLFVNWMDTHIRKGCFNLRCAGFVQVSKQIMLGGTLPNVSRYGREQFAFSFTTYKDTIQAKWWVLFQGEPVGYWPLGLIENFELVPRVNWGGSACNLQAHGLHTTTQMGSGHFPREGYTRASHIRNILVMDSDKVFVRPSYIEHSDSYEGCYRVEDCTNFPGDKGLCILYGGPGGICCDARCRK